MASTPLSGFVAATVDNTYYTLITAPLGSMLVLRQLIIRNAYASPAYFEIRVHDKTPSVLNRLVYRNTIAAGAVVDLNNIFIVLLDGDYLQVSTNHATFYFYAVGVEDVPATPDYYRAYVNSYTADTWTDLLVAPATEDTLVRGVMVCNPVSSSRTFTLRVGAYQVYSDIVLPGYGYWVGWPMLGIPQSQALQFYAYTNTDLEFSAWGGRV